MRTTKLVIAALLLSVNFLFADDLILVKRFPVLKQDTVAGYCFIYQQQNFDKKNHKYIMEMYNQDMVQNGSFSFLMTKDYFINSPDITTKSIPVTVRDNIVIIPFFWADMGADYGFGNIKEPNRQFVVIDLLQQKILSQEVMETGDEEMMLNSWMFLKNNRIIKQDIAASKEERKQYGKYVHFIEWFDFSLKKLGRIPVVEEGTNIVNIAKVFSLDNDTICLYVLKTNEFKFKKQLYDYDLWFVSLKEGKVVAKIPVNSENDKNIYTPDNIVNGAAPGEFIATGSYITLTDEKGFMGFKKAESLGAVAWKINLQNKANPVKRKEYRWKETFGNVLEIDEKGKLGEEAFAECTKVYVQGGKLNLLYSVQCVRTNASIGFGLIVGQNIYMPLPANSGDITPSNAVSKSLFVLELDNDLGVSSTKTLGEQAGAIKYDENKYFDANIMAYYNNKSGALNILSIVSANKKTPFKKSKVVSILSRPGEALKTDEFDFSEKATTTEFFPAKEGYIVILEYFEKEKKITKRIEKLNY